MKYVINLLGNGQEYLVGSVGEDIYNFFQESEIGFHKFINENLDEESLSKIPKCITENYNFDFSQRYEYDDIVHVSGAYFEDYTYIQVVDENENIVYESEVGNESNPHTFDIKESVYTHHDSRYVIVGNEYAEGQWDGFELNLENGEFDPAKLKIWYNMYDENFEIISGMEYDGIKLEPNGDLGTSGSGSNWFLRDNETFDELC
jgi:hypothetical protein